MKPKRIGALALFVLAALSLGACTGLRITGGSSWKEEALLHDGRTLIVERWITRGEQHEINQPSSISEEGLRFNLPGTRNRIEWKRNIDEAIGYVELAPLHLDVIAGSAYLVTEPIGCPSFIKWGRPYPPYVIFKYQNRAWKQIPIQEFPPQPKTPNLLISEPDVVINNLGTRYVTVEMIQKVQPRIPKPGVYPYPFHQVIVREPMLGWGSSDCKAMTRNRKPIQPEGAIIYPPLEIMKKP